MADATPVFSFPFPEGADPADVPADMEALALSIETLLNGGITAAMLSANSVGASEIIDASVTDAELASPNNSVYRTLLTSRGFIAWDAAAGTYMMGSVSGVSSNLLASAQSFSLASSSIQRPPDLLYFDDADYAVASKTQKLRVRAQVAANATAPGINFTFGLYPVTVAGAADALAFTVGTVVSGSTVALNTPSASAIAQGNSGDLTIPSDGAYILGVVTSGTIANNSAVALQAHLQARSV